MIMHCLQLRQTELTETDATCLSGHSGGIGASAGHRGGCLDQRPGSVLNPIAHPYQWERCASAFPAYRERHRGRELSFYMNWVISEAQETQMFKMQIVFFKMNGSGCLAMRHYATGANKSTILSSVQSTWSRVFLYLCLSSFLLSIFTSSSPDVIYWNLLPPSDLVSQCATTTKQVKKIHFSHFGEL